MSIQIHMMALGMLPTNAYVIADDETHNAVLIDPSDEPYQIIHLLEENNYTVKEILATHGHFDHVLASQALKEHTQAPFRIHEKDLGFLEKSEEVARAYGIKASPPAKPDSYIEDGDVFEVDSIRLETIFTPGHAPGHVSFVLASEQAVFSGDCLFAGSIGRTDLPGADYETLMKSISNKLLPLGDDFTVYNGHGPITTIGKERQTNPFVTQWLRMYGN